MRAYNAGLPSPPLENVDFIPPDFTTLSFPSPREYRWTIFSVRVCATRDVVFREDKMVEGVESSVCEWNTSCQRLAVAVYARYPPRKVPNSCRGREALTRRPLGPIL